MDRLRAVRGFTSIELLLVVVIVGILAGLAVTRINHVRYGTDSGAQSVATTLLVAQRAAVTQEHDVVVTFDAPNRQVAVLHDADNDGLPDAAERIRRFTLEPAIAIGRGGAPPRPMGAAAVNFTRVVNGLPAVVFHRNGSASSAGGLYVTSRRAVTDSAHRADTRALEVVRATGRTEWWRYDGSAWKRGF